MRMATEETEQAARARLFRPASFLPTGEQFAIRHGDREAVVTEVGATLRAFTVAGQPFVDGFGAEELITGSRGVVLLPWPNRIAQGRYTFAGQTQQLPIAEAATGNAIHGLTRWANWMVIAHAADRIALGYLLHPQSGYPFLLALEVEYRLSDAGLWVRIAATNVGTSPAPFGAGHHPYFTVGTEFVDEVGLHVPAGTYFVTDARGIPTGRASVAGTEIDFRAERPIGALHVDTGYTDLAADADGWRRISMTHPSGAPRLTVAMDAAFRYAQVYSGDTLPPALRRRGLAIEPMSCTANAFNSGEGLVILQPGDRWSGAWEARVTG
jgi:aldose 1-epimerase